MREGHSKWKKLHEAQLGSGKAEGIWEWGQRGKWGLVGSAKGEVTGRAGQVGTFEAGKGVGEETF